MFNNRAVGFFRKLFTPISAASSRAKEFKYFSYMEAKAIFMRFGMTSLFETIEKETKGTQDELTFTSVMSGRLPDAFTILGRIHDGAIDGGITIPIFNAGELKAHFTLNDLQALTRDGYSAAAASTETLLLNCPECLADYDKNNTMSLGVTAGAPYYLMCAFEAKTMDDLRGKKVAIGNPMFDRWAAALGMSGKSGSIEYIRWFERGVVDCIFGQMSWLNFSSFKDVVKVVVEDVSHGVVPTYSLMTVNKKSWADLSENQRRIIVKHMPDTIMRIVRAHQIAEKQGEEVARAKGFKFVKLGPAYVKAWEDFKAKEVAAVTDSAKKRGVKSADAIVKTNLDSLKKWEAIVDRLDHDPVKIAGELRKEVYDKIKL